MMKNNNLALYLLITLVIAIAANIGLAVKMNAQKHRLESVIRSKEDTLRTWQDDAGRWRAEALTARVTNSEMKKFFATEALEIRKDFDVKLKNVTGYLKATTYTTQSITMPRDSNSTVIVKTIDGTDTARYNFNDHWASISASLSNSQLSILYRVRDSLSFVSHWKSQGLFRPSVLKIDGVSYNPNTQITGLQNIQITVPARRLSAGLFAGYGLAQGEKFGIVAGIGIQYRLIGR